MDTLTLARMQQVVSAINLRKLSSSRERRTETSWMVRSLATFIALGYFSEDNSKALDAAGGLSMDEIEKQILDSKLHESEVPEPELREGGHERLMQAFGGVKG